MITRIRDVRKAKGLTLEDVASRCEPPTTPQTIGRLETGTRTISVKWLNRIATALGVTATDLVELPETTLIPVIALVGATGVDAPLQTMTLVPPTPAPGVLGLRMVGALGDYRVGDELWCEQLAPEMFWSALNRDIVAPRPGGRFAFGRLLDCEGDTLHILPPIAGQRQFIVPHAPWLARPVRLIRAL